MRVHNGNALDLSGAQGEQITVTVEETTKKPLLVSFTINGKPGSLSPGKSSDSFSFQLDKGERDPTLLTMLFTFTGSDDHYNIFVQGQGGDTSRFAVVQDFNVPGDSITYTIDIT
jgi:hypothetical protein